MQGNQILKEDKSTYVYEYAIVFILIIYAARTSEFVRAIDGWNNIFGLLLPIAGVIFIAFLKNVNFNHKFWLLILGYTLWFAATTVKFHELHPRFYGINLIKMVIAYIVISGLRYRFFKFYEEILFYLCIIALVFWVLQNAIPGIFIEFLRNFEFSTQGDEAGIIDFNTIVYTVNNFVVAPTSIMHFGGLNVYRNAGYAWEPGAFSSYINIAIFVNLIRNNFKLKGNKHIWVFIPALATTFSTTGYSIFILLVLFYMYNQELVKIIWLVPLIIIAGVSIFSLPFMAEKISKSSDKNKLSTEQMIYNSAKYKTSYAPQRFQSLEIDFVDFLNNPVIGYGGHQEARWTNKLGAQISTASGIGKVLGQYGIVGTIFFLMSLWISSRQIMTLYKVRGTIFPVMLFLFISISYDIIFTGLLMCFWLLYISNFLKRETIKKHVIYNMLKNRDANPGETETTKVIPFTLNK